MKDQGVAFLPKKNPRFQKGFEKCFYRWADSHKWRLACSTHKDGHPGIIIPNWLGSGSETLIALLEEGMLTGEALKDAKKLAEERSFIEGL